MNSYSPERKSAILKKLLPPLSMSVAEVSRQENISTVTLYTWRKQLRERGGLVPDSQLSPEQWSAEAKLAVVAETLTLPEVELSEYCRKKGLLPEQVKAWKDVCLNSQRPPTQPSKAKAKAEAEEARRDKKRIRELEKELRRKERALAETAVVAGARRWRACEEMGISLRTVQRWMNGDTVKADARTTCVQPEPINKLSEQERQRVLNVCNSADYAQLPPSQIVPRLADKGIYIASESTFYRVLKAHDQCHRRGRAQASGKHKAPTSYRAKAANQVWSWDITYLPTQVRGQF